MSAPTVDLGYGELALSTARYFDGALALVGTYVDCPLERETVSVNLGSYGLAPEMGNVFIKDWPESEGWTDKLVAAGLAEKVREVKVGPYELTAYEVRLPWLEGAAS